MDVRCQCGAVRFRMPAAAPTGPAESPAAKGTGTTATDTADPPDTDSDAVSVAVSPVQPAALFHCHCNECRHQSSSAYGTSAIFAVDGEFPLNDPALRAALSVYIRPGARSRTGRDMACFFCTRCGARVLHRSLARDSAPRADSLVFDGNTVSVKGGLIEGLNYARATHIYTAFAVVPIPDGAVQYPGTPPGSP